MFKKILFSLVTIFLGFTSAYAQWSTLPAGQYYIKSCVNSNYALDYNAGNTSNGTQIQCWEFNGSAAQNWYITSEGNVTHFHPSRNILTCLDDNGCNIFDGNKIHVWEGNGSGAQNWYLQHHGGDVYSIHSAINSNYVLDIPYEKAYNGNPIQLYHWKGGNNQKWHFVRIGGGSTGATSGGGYIVNPYTPTTHSCGVCSGTGRCSGCGGSGISPNHAPGIIAKCGYCGGTGRCATCHGSGTTTY